MGPATLLALVSFSACHLSSDDGATPVELGTVAWERDHEAAFARARASGRPLFLLFQEIPGCGTCQAFGRGPLSHPLLVDAIETSFVPLAINNRPGQDHGLLARYDEPALNNPVVRFFAADGRELVARRQGVWEAGATAERMVAALRAGGEVVPAYLELVNAELSSRLPERAVFGMSCFWEGQAALGGLDGVLGARPGWLDGGEVVEVLYDPRAVDFGALVRAARASGCGARVLTDDTARLDEARELAGPAAGLLRAEPRAAQASDDLWHLRRSALWHLPLTPLQALRVNAALQARQPAERYLAPFQLALVPRIEAALARDAHALDGLERPARFESPEELERQRRELEERL